MVLCWVLSGIIGVGEVSVGDGWIDTDGEFIPLAITYF